MTNFVDLTNDILTNTMRLDALEVASLKSCTTALRFLLGEREFFRTYNSRSRSETWNYLHLQHNNMSGSIIGTRLSDEAGKSKKSAAAKKPVPAKKPTPTKKLAPAKQPKPVKEPVPAKETASKPYPSKKARKGKVQKIRKGQDPMHLVDEDYKESQPAPEPQIDEDEINLQRGIQMSLEDFDPQGQARHAPVGGVVIRESVLVTPRPLPDVQGKGKAITTDELAAQRAPGTHDVTLDTSTGPSAQPQDDTSANVVHDTPSPIDAETGADTESSDSKSTEIMEFVEEKVDDVSNTVALEERTNEFDEGQAGSDPGRTHESRALP
ncbi:hypothetical protein Tco_0947852 [Tanacetum coccineum]